MAKRRACTNWLHPKPENKDLQVVYFQLDNSYIYTYVAKAARLSAKVNSIHALHDTPLYAQWSLNEKRSRPIEWLTKSHVLNLDACSECIQSNAVDG